MKSHPYGWHKRVELRPLIPNMPAIVWVWGGGWVCRCMCGCLWEYAIHHPHAATQLFNYHFNCQLLKFQLSSPHPHSGVVNLNHTKMLSIVSTVKVESWIQLSSLTFMFCAVRKFNSSKDYIISLRWINIYMRNQSTISWILFRYASQS
jgi:hypothetical protein